jgi:quinol monooxygenase YgiN
MEHNQIHFRAEFTIEEGKIEEYKKLVQDLSRVVEANEPDTISYQFYLNRDETKCIVRETYANSEAVLAHNTGIASQTILPKIFSFARISRFDVYGNPSEELQKVLTSFAPQIYNLFARFSR